MKKNRIIMCILLSGLVTLSGCKDTSTTKLSYKLTSAGSGVSIPIIDELSKPSGYLFASEKCVLSGDYNDSDDNLKAESAMIINQTDQSAIFGSNPYERLYPASTTKILTAYIVLKYADLNDVVEISHDAANIAESGVKLCGYKEGDKVTARDLLYSMLVYSGNDAATALGCHISGSEEEFAKLMNSEAAKLGATDSHFTNANGLHNDNHYTTSYDLYLIFSECLKYDEFRKIINLSSYTVNYTDSSGGELSKTFESTNQYIIGSKSSPQGITVIGGKTGTTSKAGNCLLLYTQDMNGKDYISIVLKADTKDSLYQQMNYLLELITM